MRYRLTPRAQADLDEIWSYTADRWSVDQAEVYLREIEAALKSAADSGARGRRCDDIRPAYFRRAAGDHVIFYRLSEAGIDVVRILHGRMDFQGHLR